jgi:hypothetical protein
MESLLSDEEVSWPNFSNVSKRPQLLIALLDLGQIFTRVSGCRFPSSCYEITTW